jgi:hypothetical protein
MVKVKYIGDISPMRISLSTGMIDNWKKGEVRELQNEVGEKLVKENINFSLVNKELEDNQEKEILKTVKSISKIKVKEEN